MGDMKKKKKKYRLNAKFYCWIFTFSIIVMLGYGIKSIIQFNTIPNFYGWTADEVMKFHEKHENITVIYELVYSYDILQNRVMEQSIKPRTKVGQDPLVLTVTVSKGSPVMDDLTGQSIGQVLEFATQLDLDIDANVINKSREGNGVVATQSIAMGQTLDKNSILTVTLTGQTEPN